MTIPNYFSQKVLAKQSLPFTFLPQNSDEKSSFSVSLPHASTQNTVFFYAQPMPSPKVGNLMELSQPSFNLATSHLNSALSMNSSYNQLSLENLMSLNQQACIQHTFPANHIMAQLNPQILVQRSEKPKTLRLKGENTSEKHHSTKDQDNSKQKKSFQRFGTLKRQQEQQNSASVSFINKKETSVQPELKHMHKDSNLKNTSYDTKDYGGKCQRQINQDELLIAAINQNTQSLLNKRNLLNMLETEKPTKFQKIKTSNNQSPLYISPNLSLSPESLQDSIAFKSKLEKMKLSSPYKKLHTEPQPQAAPQIVYSAIQYPQMPMNFVQNNPVVTGAPNQMMMNPQISFGNPQQSQYLIPASFPMQDKMMAPVMVPSYPGMQGNNFVPNGQCYILMNQPPVMANQPTIFANQPITFNIQNNYNSIPPNYQQAPKIEYITNLYCPNSNNNIFTSETWQGKS